MGIYNFKNIEQKWQEHWKSNELFKVTEDDSKQKYYVLDMFPYPSGAGLHVGHPLGYIASDIVTRYKRLNGFNVLHPMGFDAFGLPAEQYAIQTGKHPAITTEANIKRYKEQLNRIGFAFDWSREVQTCDPSYYKWTQWIFSEFFNAWYNKKTNKAESIDQLISIFEIEGNVNIEYHGDPCESFTGEDWENFSAQEKENILQCYRLAFQKETSVNWCPELGTVLANEEVKDGKSERGGYDVIQKKMSQWYLRITAYADRLLDGLNKIEWSESIKEIQRNWIGKSEGASLHFKVKGSAADIEVFTTRPDTVFGASFMVLAPEHELISSISTDSEKEAVQAYIDRAQSKSERERMMNKEVSGCFTGAYAINPFNQKEIPIYIAEYVLAGYGTGAIMAVPAHDERDHAFAKKYNLNIVQVVEGKESVNIQEASYDAKEGRMINSEMINGLDVKNAIRATIQFAEEKGFGTRTINYKLRDAGFSRQRYWGEPFPILHKDGIPSLVDELPVTLPDVQSYEPAGTGESPLARVEDWVNTPEGRRETDTMPGWAGSSWYFLRYMDPNNDEAFASPEKLKYWNQVDLYMGGAEHATGHLLYSRFWTKFLYDLGRIDFDEPFKKLINQGMIQGQSRVINFIRLSFSGSFWGDNPSFPDPNEVFGRVLLTGKLAQFLQNASNQDFVKLKFEEIFLKKYKKYKVTNNEISGSLHPQIPSDLDPIEVIRIPLEFVDKNGSVNFELFLKENKYNLPENTSIFDLSEANEIIEYHEESTEVHKNYFQAGIITEKMSKRWGNVVNPDDVCDEYGADTLRLYEMFLGPLQDSKPWSTQGIDGTHRFLKKLWNLCFDQDGNFLITDETPSKDSLKSLHKTIKKVSDDIEQFSFNTSVSQFMICVNELSSQNCKSKSIIEPLLILLSPFAPHISEELWEKLGNTESILNAQWPEYDESQLVESVKLYPISINGKTRTQIEFPLDMDKNTISEKVLEDEVVQKWLEGKAPKKIIVVPGRIVNLVI